MTKENINHDQSNSAKTQNTSGGNNFWTKEEVSKIAKFLTPGKFHSWNFPFVIRESMATILERKKRQESRHFTNAPMNEIINVFIAVPLSKYDVISSFDISTRIIDDLNHHILGTSSMYNLTRYKIGSRTYPANALKVEKDPAEYLGYLEIRQNEENYQFSTRYNYFSVIIDDYREDFRIVGRIQKLKADDQEGDSDDDQDANGISEELGDYQE